MSAIFAGTAARLLCLPLFVGVLVSCQGTQPQRIADVNPGGRPPAQDLMKEFQANFDGVKKASSKATGAPVHVDPSVPPATAGSAHDEHHAHKAGDPKGC